MQIKFPKGVYGILGEDFSLGRTNVETARLMVDAGINILQYREKSKDRGEMLAQCLEIRKITAAAGVPFIVNDFLDIALLCRADGVHLGQEDLPLTEARSLLSPDKIIGCSAVNLSESLKAESEGADYIAVGSIYPTSSKKEYRLAGLETLRQVRGKISLPLIAIGGINESNTAEVIEAGADGIAVISAVLGAKDVERAARDLTNKIERAGSENE